MGGRTLLHTEECGLGRSFLTEERYYYFIYYFIRFGCVCGRNIHLHSHFTIQGTNKQNREYMRTLLLLHGLPGSGKSTWIKDNGLELYTLSPDEYRLRLAGLKYDVNGNTTINDRLDRVVWQRVYEDLEIRMSTGSFTVMDATHISGKGFKKYKELCEKYKYTCFIKSLDTPIEECIDRQAKRTPSYKFVSEEAIRSMDNRRANIPSWIKPINNIKEILQIPITKVDNEVYDDIVFIGDLHGEYDKLMEAIPEYHDNVLYVFLGDFFDSVDNPDGEKSLFNLLHRLVDKKNVLFVEGNHDRHLHTILHGGTRKGEFYTWLTEPRQMKMLSRIWRKFSQALHIQYNGKDYLVNHGGLSGDLSKIQLLPSQALLWGMGEHTEDIGLVYNDPNRIQIHGHRRATTTDKNICLEGGVKEGGYIRIYSIKDGIKEIGVGPTSNQEINQILLHKHVNVVKQEYNGDTIVTANFTREAFQKGIWDSISLKARGLFLDTDGNVIIRGFDKFFNLDEESGYTVDDIKDKFVPPFVVSTKINGFLGLCSVYKGEMIYASKKRLDSMHANIFRKLFEEKLTDEQKNTIKEICSYGSTALFEVCSPFEDPHCILEKEGVYLLGFVSNDISVSTNVSFDTGAAYECLRSLRPKTIKTYDADVLLTYLNGAKSTHLEGYVIRDRDGRTFKYKTNYYLLKRALFKKEFDNKMVGDVEYIKRLHEKIDREVVVKLPNFSREEWLISK